MAGREVPIRAGVMTTRAQRPFLLFQETRIGAAMRHVARRAVLGGRLMGDLLREVALLVAAQTQRSLGLLEDGRVVGAVWVMAAGALFDAGVSVALRQLRLLARVTLEAEARLFGLQPQGADQSVRFVAGRAVALLCRGMRHLDGGDHLRVTLEAVGSLLEARTSAELPCRHLEAGKAEDQAEKGDLQDARVALSQGPVLHVLRVLLRVRPLPLPPACPTAEDWRERPRGLRSRTCSARS